MHILMTGGQYLSDTTESSPFNYQKTQEINSTTVCNFGKRRSNQSE